MSDSFQSKFIQSAIVGVTPYAIMFAAGHPFDLLKTRMQASLNNKSGWTIAKNIYVTKGLPGFYKAGVTNFSRGLLKEGYRNPLRGYFNHLYGKQLPREFKTKYPDAKNLLTGVTMSSVDVLIACPLERVKVWLMTNTSNKPESVFSYLANPSNRPNNAGLLRDLFRGLNVSFYRSSISWCSYLIVEERVRFWVLFRSAEIRGEQGWHWHAINDTPIVEQLVIGLLCGVCNSGITLPLDSVKTHLQKREFATSSIPIKVNESFFGTMKRIVETSGLKGLYAGWQFRVPHYVIIAVLTSANIQRINKIWEKSP